MVGVLLNKMLEVLTYFCFMRVTKRVNFLFKSRIIVNNIRKILLMHKIVLWIFIGLSTLCFGQKAVDTTQISFLRPANTIAAQEAPYVVFISIDGFRYDYIDKYDAKNIKALAESGVWAKDGMYPSYPSSTFPNHWSLITGMFPSHHKLIDNVFYDPNRDYNYRIGTKTMYDGSWYKGLPLWGLAEAQGMRSASLFWVGSESDAAGLRPSYYYRYHEKFKGEDKARIIKNWLELPESDRPHFITLYFPEVDHAGHSYGPDAKETEDSVHYVDDAIKTLTETLAPLGLPINYVLVSDHGMIEIHEDHYINMPKIDDNKYTVVNRSTMVRIHAKDHNDIQPLYKSLKADNHPDYEVYLANEFPEKLHHSTLEDTTRIIGDIILVPHGPRIFVYPGQKRIPGRHGFSPYDIPEMKATFLAWGPAFKSHDVIPSFQNVNVYPLIAEILGLKISHKIDGNINVLRSVLSNE